MRKHRSPWIRKQPDVKEASRTGALMSRQPEKEASGLWSQASTLDYRWIEEKGPNFCVQVK